MRLAKPSNTIWLFLEILMIASFEHVGIATSSSQSIIAVLDM
jgi:hypothetical protein